MNRRQGKRLLCVIAAFLCLAGGAAFAQQQKVETFVGRGNEVKVIQEDGTVEEVGKGGLVILNRSNAAGRAAPSAKEVQKPRIAPAENGNKSKEGAKPAEETKADQKTAGEGAADEQSASKPPGKRGQSPKDTEAAEAKRKADDEQAAKERAEAIRESNIDEIRKLQWQGAWFYDKNGKPVSQEDLDKRVQAGDVSDIQARDIYLQEWKMEPDKPPAEKQGSPWPSTNVQENPVPATEAGER